MANEELREYELGRREYRAVKRYLEGLCSRKMATRFSEIGNYYYINKEVFGEVIVANLDSGTGILKIIGDSSVLGEMSSITSILLESRLNTRRVTKLNVKTT
ncbi:hypothetical protein J4422_03000 [Candidatus Pacearchaeota archaeon]|nr:hypothetical protein [Candidatus Pacearchaeota archaeon]